MAPPILLSCEGISKAYGVTTLFTDLTWTLYEGDHVGLVGPNGAGKSTLLKILAGLDMPDRGTRTARRQLRIGYVAQDPPMSLDRTVEEELSATVTAGGLDVHEHAGRIAHALSLGAFSETSRQIGALSGGWRKRLAIVQALMLDPDVLLMDEPTNHLDIDGILWLESLLQSQAKAFIVISHDRRFLESVTSRMLELNRCYPTGLFESKGRYSDFLEQRASALQGQADYQASLANRVRREVEWLRRGAKARTTKAKGRIQAAERLIGELQRTESRSQSATVGIDFSATGRKSKQLLVAAGVGKSLGGHTIISELELRLGPGERVGLLGPNGSGKTTLLEMLAGRLAPDTGTITRADGLRISSFQQHRDSLDQDAPLRRALAPAGDLVIYRTRSMHLASWAKRFLFRPEQLDLPVARLSGGEQARLLIARLMLQPADVLLLDEPTNDLDIPTLDVLEESLMEFPGAVVLVTHDRWLLDRVSTALLALDGEGRTSWYADLAQWEAARTRNEPSSRSTANPAEASSRPDARAPRSPRKRKLSHHEQREWETIEDTINQAEGTLRACEAAVEDPAVASNASELQLRLDALEAARAEVERLYLRWSELEEKQLQALPPS